MINIVSANSHQFQRHIIMIDKNYEGFSSAVSKQLKKDFDLSDMYIITPQIPLEESVADLGAVVERIKAARNEGFIDIPVVGDLNELLESIEKDLANGETLRGAFQNWIDKCVREHCSEKGVLNLGTIQADLITVNPDTGEVFNSMPKGRCLVLSKKVQDMDYAMAKAQADDLATFLRYRVFKQDYDDPEKTEALIAEIKAKQSDYDTSRFLPIFSSAGEQGRRNADFLIHFFGLDKLRWDELSEEERDKLADQLTDELMETLGEHYSSKDNNVGKDDGLHEEMKKMQTENVGKAKITRRVLAEL